MRDHAILYSSAASPRIFASSHLGADGAKACTLALCFTLRACPYKPVSDYDGTNFGVFAPSYVNHSACASSPPITETIICTPLHIQTSQSATSFHRVHFFSHHTWLRVNYNGSYINLEQPLVDMHASSSQGKRRNLNIAT